MKKFRFRLEAMLRALEHFEKEKQKHLAQASRKVINQNDALSLIEKKRNDTTNEQRQETQHDFKVADLLVYSRYFVKLKKEMLLGKQLLDVLRKDEEKKRADLLEASRKKKKYEKLREKQKSVYLLNCNKLVDKESDESAISHFRFRRH